MKEVRELAVLISRGRNKRFKRWQNGRVSDMCAEWPGNRRVEEGGEMT